MTFEKNKWLLAIECIRKACIRVDAVQCTLVRRTKISYRVATALVGIPRTSVLDTWVDVIYNYMSSGTSRRHNLIAPLEQAGELEGKRQRASFKLYVVKDIREKRG